MKNTAKALLAALLLSSAAGAYAEDKYEVVAKEITEAGSGLANKKIAIIPFSYADGRAATKDGAIISEKITMRLIKQQKFDVIERSVLDKVMAELKLQSSGAMDATSTKELGKLLGVEAIVTGTLVEMQGNKIEVNARLIKTETAQAIGASQVTIQKDWIGGDAASAPQQQAQPAYQQPAYQQPYSQPAQAQRAPRGEFAYGFFDLFMGFGAPNMSLEFANPNNNVTISNDYQVNNDIGIRVPTFPVGGNNYRSVKFDKLATEGFGPVAFRVGGFGNGPVGGDMELSFESRNIKAQTAAWLLNGAAAGNVTFSTNDYATVKTFGISGDLLLRVPTKKVDPYFGIGLGMSLNSITLPYAKAAGTTTTLTRPGDDFGVGFMFRIPVGARIKAGQNFQIVTELRYEMNHIMFDRGIAGEDDRITLSGAKFIVGMGFTF